MPCYRSKQLEVELPWPPFSYPKIPPKSARRAAKQPEMTHQHPGETPMRAPHAQTCSSQSSITSLAQRLLVELALVEGELLTLEDVAVAAAGLAGAAGDDGVETTSLELL